MTGPNDPSEDRRRVDRLLDAVLAVGSDLDLKVVLQRIVEVAATLVDARYGALGVADDEGLGLSQFITVGLDADGIARIGPPPTGHGVLGELLRTPQPLRLARLADHPRSSGFPPGHPPMGSFLGVPVRVGQRVFGNLYLTEKRNGEAFNQDDENVVIALAGAAGVAVHNARLYDHSRRQAAWMEAGRVISTSLLSGTQREDVIALVVERAREVLSADVALVALATDDQLKVETAAGCDGPSLLEQLAKPLDEVVRTGQPVDLVADDMSGAAVPLGPIGQPCRGVLLLLWTVRPDPWELHDLAGFATQAAVAFELADRRDEAARFAIVDDRDRIGRDLHDLVIQRLFATGMQLQSAIRLVDQDANEARQRINRAVDELDGTIRELRSTIYGLQAPMEGRPSLRAQVLQAVDVSAPALGFAPTLRLDGLLDTLATQEAAEHLIATLREALSNVARHASATRVEVVAAIRGDSLQLTVQDNGVGMPEAAPRSGLLNLASRAEQLRGSLELSTPATGGTQLRWVVPI